MINDKTVRRYESSGGIAVYKLSVEAFPNHVTNCYLVMDDPITLLDTGSGWETSNQDFEAGFETLREDFGENVHLKDVGRVILTHGHVDHFGGVNYVCDASDAQVGIHELDASVIQNFKERLLVSSTNLHVYLDRSGLSDKKVGATSFQLFDPMRYGVRFRHIVTSHDYLSSASGPAGPDGTAATRKPRL